MEIGSDVFGFFKYAELNEQNASSSNKGMLE